MTTRIDDEGICAFNPPPRSEGAAPAPRSPARRGRWPCLVAPLLVAALVLTTLAVLLGLWLAYEGLPELARHWDIVVDGQRIGASGLPGAGPSLSQLLLAVAVGVAIVLVVTFVLSVLVPLAVGIGLLGALLGLVAALFSGVATAAVVLAPLWLLALALWFMSRRRHPATGPTA